MENTFQTSFIPKKPIDSSVSSKEPMSLFSIISIFLLIIAILASGGLFFYKTYLTKQKETLSASLATVRDSFEKNTIDELGLFNKRTDTAKQILGNHVVLSPLFSLIGDITIPSIQYTSFNQQTNEKGFVVNMSGVARDYRSIALQADMFNTAKGSSFKNVIFSNLTKDKSNNVLFNLEFTVDSSVLSYEKNNIIEQPKKVITPTTVEPLQDSNNMIP
jgi:hypothetical protein